MNNLSKMQREWFERYQIAKSYNAKRKVRRGIVSRELA
jgi:hypothetical protein